MELEHLWQYTLGNDTASRVRSLAQGVRENLQKVLECASQEKWNIVAPKDGHYIETLLSNYSAME